MIIVRDVAALQPDQRPCVLALGEFDGVHLGHRAVLRRLTESARESSHAAVVVSVVRHDVLALSRLRQRVQRIAAYDVNVLFLVHPSLTRSPRAAVLAAVTRLSAGRVISTVVLGAADAWCRDPIWNSLRARVEPVPMVSIDGDEVATDAIRAAVVAGDLPRVQRISGAAYAVGGRVVSGVRRGRTLGFPTANVHVRGVLLPPNGVYAVLAKIGTAVHQGVANLGFNPTFANSERSLEAHLFDFDGDLYGRYIDVTFVAFLRGERKFPTVDALVEQIRRDASTARRLLS